MPKSLYLIIICSILFYGCKKEKQKPVQQNNTVKISLVSGDNQASITGKALTDSIVVKVTREGTPLSNGIVQFTGLGCSSDLSVKITTKADGTAKYLWRLAANQGAQILNVVAFDGTAKADSVEVHANATSENSSTIAACIPYDMPPINIVKLSTGRLLACFQGNTALRYSDDNAVSWNPVKSFGYNRYTVALAITPKDEIFAATFGDGIYYSKDAGATWTDITPSTFNKAQYPADMAYTNNGTLIFTGYENQVFISADKGKTWANSSKGLTPNFSYLFPCRLNNGDLYLVSLNEVLYKSIDNGANWMAQNDASTKSVPSIYVDNNGWFYESTFTNADGFTTIYISKDNRQTFTILYTIRDFADTISILPDGHFYYSNLDAIYQVYDQYNIRLLVYNNTSYINNHSFLLSQNRFIYIGQGIIRMTDL
jgi:photosystem II stability/assembly factor-like uncharacterized protein